MLGESGELGFEPRQTAPEAAVLPLHHSPLMKGIITTQGMLLKRAKKPIPGPDPRVFR